MVYHCGMEAECTNNDKLIGFQYTPTGVEGVYQPEGLHESYEAAQQCVHSKEPAKWKKLNPR